MRTIDKLKLNNLALTSGRTTWSRTKRTWLAIVRVRRILLTHLCTILTSSIRAGLKKICAHVIVEISRRRIRHTQILKRAMAVPVACVFVAEQLILS